ncbi:histidine phosphatase family protein [Massilia sp. IC2-477]|uniref:histidine phosphatase family protein n=1 Tax=Massilia sp. IC2-477 TaxID=2887198 RepID=UPI001D128DBB|nr:histidine phosphatase family protein [Massilia sp. IC2-477]MCC2958775.1 histidine phosphatase family protein [Massilia sp. IC2-477]
MELVLVRHPQPEIAPGICYGRANVSTSIEATTRVVASLRAAGLPGALPIYASPLARCSMLANSLGVPVTFDARLAEMDFGAWEMQGWDAIPRAEVDAWTADLLHYRPGGGENVLDVARRVAAFRKELQHPALVICHAGTIRLLSALHAGGTLEEAALRAANTAHRIAYGEVIVLKD